MRHLDYVLKLPFLRARFLVLSGTSVGLSALLLRHLALQCGYVTSSIFIALGRRQPPPFAPLHIIFCHALPSSIQKPRLFWPIGQILVGGFAIPLNVLRRILCHTLRMRRPEHRRVHGFRLPAITSLILPSSTNDSFVQTSEQRGWQNHENKESNREGKDEMDGGDVHKTRFVWVLRIMLVRVPRWWLPLARNRLKVLPHNRTSGHQIPNAQAGNLRGLSLDGGVLSKSRRQRLTQPNLSHDQSNDGQTNHDEPDSEDAASKGGCFHGPTLAFEAPRVLIERNHAAIDGTDERWKPVNLCEAETGRLHPGTEHRPRR